MKKKKKNRYTFKKIDRKSILLISLIGGLSMKSIKPFRFLAIILSFSLIFSYTQLPLFGQETPEQWFKNGEQSVIETNNIIKNLLKQFQSEDDTENPYAAKNVILFVGDGMGVTSVTAARILEGQLNGGNGEEHHLSFELFPYLALSKTYNTNQQTPDSAGTMTGMMTGIKTKAGVISVNQNVVRGDYSTVLGNELETLLEKAEKENYATGVVTTARLTHATPGACYAHSPERNWEDDSKLPDDAKSADFPDIARQLIEFPYGDGLEVAMGGGRRHFLPVDFPDPEDDGKFGQREDNRNLTTEWVDQYANAAYVVSIQK